MKTIEPQVSPHPQSPWDHLPVCQWCGCTARHIPDLTISADGRCGICEVEWRALQAEGWTHRQLVNRWNRAANHRRADRKARIAEAHAAKQCREAA